jgi:hypothetical protein
MLLLVVRCQEIASKEFIFKIFLAGSSWRGAGYSMIMKEQEKNICAISYNVHCYNKLLKNIEVVYIANIVD